MDHNMNNILANELPLREFPRAEILAGTTLHHFGILDALSHDLDRPLWVSDNYECAVGYKNFGVPAPRYTTLTASKDFEIIDLNGIRLQPIAMQLKIYDHSNWNKCLATYLSQHGVAAIVYAGREIFLPEPSRVAQLKRSVPC